LRFEVGNRKPTTFFTQPAVTKRPFFVRSYENVEIIETQTHLAGGTESGSQHLVSPEMLKHAGLKILWENELPIKKTESVDRLFLLGSRIYLISDHNYVLSLNRTNGKIVFGKTVTPASLLVTGMTLFGDQPLYVNGSTVVQIDPESGLATKTVDLGQGMTCPAARNTWYFYLAGVDNRLHILRAEDGVEVFEVAADSEATITSVLANDNLVIFATAAGEVISLVPNRPERIWQFNAAGAIAGPVVRDYTSLFFASKDTNVYRLDIVEPPEKRRLVWQYQAPGVLEAAPRVTQTVVYQRVPDKGVVAIDKQAGSFLWTVPGGVDLLAESRGKAYIITRAGTLVVMDNHKRKELCAVNFAGVLKYAANGVDDKIYIADKRGRIACLQPVE
jgi:outer membrane protein assembly factor BamB